jgi:hypothetical protein
MASGDGRCLSACFRFIGQVRFGGGCRIFNGGEMSDVDCVYIRFCGNGRLWFRPYGGSLATRPLEGAVRQDQKLQAS